MRYLTAGETHGKCLIGILEGMPSNVLIDLEKIDKLLSLRQSGYGRGGRMKIEKDRVEILSGIRNKKTLGSPIAIKIDNKDYENWKEVMSENEVFGEFKRVSNPRPGHADLAGALKYNHTDIRNVLERASARETAIRTAIGGIAEQFLNMLGVRVISYVTQIGEIKASPVPIDESLEERLDSSNLRALNSEDLMIEYIDKAKNKGDSVGGIFEVAVLNLPSGFGSYVHYDRKLDAKLAFSLMSLQAIKGVEIGLGFEAAKTPGSKVHDEIFYDAKYFRKTNNAGGVEGGMSNGEPIILRAAMKPIPTLYAPLESVNIDTKEKITASVERSDTCAVTAASIVGRAIVAFEIADAVIERFGGDSFEQIAERIKTIS